MHHSCSVCDGRNLNQEGIRLAESEVIPFFKKELLKLRYPTHPFPLRYRGLLDSLFCYSQALAYNRAHSIEATFHTENEWMLQYSKQLGDKFGMSVAHPSDLKTKPMFACEFNVEPK